MSERPDQPDGPHDGAGPVDPIATPDTPPPPPDAPSTWDRLSNIPDLEDAPLAEGWRPAASSPRPPTPPPAAAAPAPTPPPPPAPPAPSAGPGGVQADQRSIHVDPAPPGVNPQPFANGGVGAPPLPPLGPTSPAPPPPRRRRRRRLPIVAAILLFIVVLFGGFGLYGLIQWNGIDRVDTEGALRAAPSDFTNYLIVGTDSRANVDPDGAVADDVGLGFDGSRADSIMILRIGDDGNRLISLPRDLWVDIADSSSGKINAALNGGAARLITTVQNELGIPVHRYLEVDLAGFMSVVDAVGGVPVTFDSPACDQKSALDIRETGTIKLDRREALAYVRSRSYVEFNASGAEGLTCGQIISQGLRTNNSDPFSDLGRTDRQREFLLTTLSTASNSRNPITLLRVLSGMGDGLRVDDEMGMFDAMSLGRKANDLNADTIALPVVDYAAPDGSSALLMTGEADAVLELFRS